MRGDFQWLTIMTKPGVDLGAAARHLVHLGSGPDSRGRVHSRLPQPQLARLQALLAGY